MCDMRCMPPSRRVFLFRQLFFCSPVQGSGKQTIRPESRCGSFACCGATANLPAAPKAAESAQPVRVEMRNVIFRDDPARVMRIRYFDGSLVPTKAGMPPSFDDKHSFV